MSLPTQVYVVGRQQIDMKFYSTHEKGNRIKGATSKSMPCWWKQASGIRIPNFAGTTTNLSNARHILEWSAPATFPKDGMAESPPYRWPTEDPVLVL